MGSKVPTRSYKTIAAAGKGHIEVTRYLLQQGADMDRTAVDGMTPLLVAAQLGHLEVVKFKVQQGVDKNKAMHNHTTPLTIALLNGHTEIAQYLI